MTRGAALGIVVVCVLASAGCHRGARGRTLAPTIPRTLVAAARGAQEDFVCERVDQVLYIAPSVVQVRGCGRRREYMLVGRRLTPTQIAPVEALAAGEMACAIQELAVESPAPSVRSVSGCDRRARYDLRCVASGTSCAWTMTAHTGRWAGIIAPASPASIETPAVPDQFEVGWALPPGVAPSGNTAGPTSRADDLSTVTLPPPPDDTVFIPPPPSP